MTAQHAHALAFVVAPGQTSGQEITWAEIATRAPQMVATMESFLDQLAVSARATTVDAYSMTLRFFAGRVTSADPGCVTVAQIERRHIEDYKRWLAARPGKKTPTLTPTTIRHCLGLLRTFFERLIDWDYHDAPRRVPIFPGDFPQPDETLPKVLDDPTAAKFMAALGTDPNPRRVGATERERPCGGIRNRRRHSGSAPSTSSVPP